MIDMFGEEPVFRVDMNRMREQGRITALITHATSFPIIPQVEAGQWVKIVDEDGNIASAIIDRIDSDSARERPSPQPQRTDRLYLKVDMDSWQTPTVVDVTPSWTPPPLDATKLGPVRA